jgi:ABC-type phosphate transport system auxiliary subunit
VPVTAKLSKKFDEKFGDDVTNELVDWFNQVDATYRSDLRELNELNYARFEAKLEQLRAELRSEFQTGLASLEGRLLARIGILEGRFGTLEGRLVRWMFLFWAASLGTVLALR